MAEAEYVSGLNDSAHDVAEKISWETFRRSKDIHDQWYLLLLDRLVKGLHEIPHSRQVVVLTEGERGVAYEMSAIRFAHVRKVRIDERLVKEV